LEQRALDTISKRDKVKNPLIVGTAEDVSPSTKQKLYKFSAVKKEDPNGPQYAVVLDETGAVFDPDTLGKRESARLFSPARADVETEAVGPAAPLAASITINPNVNDLVLNPGDSHDEVITVTVPADSGVTVIDVYLMTDETGSMGSIIGAVQAGANSIVSTLNGMAGLDFAFGVGRYKDFPNDPFAFDHQLSLSKVPADVTTAINAWSAGGGGDGPEGQLFALDKLAVPPGAAPIGWRAGSKRLIVFFGDIAGHDPICAAISGEAADITEASVTAKLVSEKISVLAISTATPGLDGDPTIGSDYSVACGPPGGTPGQGTRLAAATGGAFVTGVDSTTIVNTIIDLVTKAATTINNINLVPTGATTPFVASISPAGGFGPLSGDDDHELKFDVSFKGVVPCADKEQVFTGTLDVVADGAVVARKRVRITVPPCKPSEAFVYSVKFICGVQDECGCEGSSVRPGKYATEINIHNYQDTETRITKNVLPVVFVGAAVGREPRVVRRRAVDALVMPPHTATMDDCHRLTELLLGAPSTSSMPLTIGFLEIVSTQELNVTAVYTASDLKSGSLSIDVEQVEGKVKKLKPEKPSPGHPDPKPDKP
jgi:hypothetical protein